MHKNRYFGGKKKSNNKDNPDEKGKKSQTGQYSKATTHYTIICGVQSFCIVSSYS